MSKPTQRALVLVGTFVLSEVAALALYKLWCATLLWDPATSPYHGEVNIALKTVGLFVLFPVGMVGYANLHVNRLVPRGDQEPRLYIHGVSARARGASCVQRC